MLIAGSYALHQGGKGANQAVAAARLGALRTGAIDTLATTQSIAQSVLNLAQATDSTSRTAS